MELTVKLAGTEYKIQQLTLGQLRDLSIGVATPDTPDPQEFIRRNFDRSVAIIRAGLSIAYPDMTPDKIYAMTITKEEMREAVDTILTFSGLIPATKVANGVGEAAAGASTTVQ